MQIQTQIKDIYSRLEDDLSKTIFENRLLHSLTGDLKYIKNIVDLLYGSNDIWNAIYENCGSVVLYGAGFLGLQFAFLCNQIEIAAFCDSDNIKQKRTHYG